MERFLAEAGTAYFWIFAAFTFFVGLFVNYSMKPIDAVMGKVSKSWKARAEKKWEGLRVQANTLNDRYVREHVRWQCLAYGQRSIWNLIIGIISSCVVYSLMASRIGVQETPSATLAYNGLALCLAGIALWRLYTAARYDKAVTRMQAALDLNEDFRQILKEEHEADVIANAQLAAEHVIKN